MVVPPLKRRFRLVNVFEGLSSSVLKVVPRLKECQANVWDSEPISASADMKPFPPYVGKERNSSHLLAIRRLSGQSSRLLLPRGPPSVKN